MQTDETFEKGNDVIGRTIRSDGVAHGGVDAVDEEARKNTTDQVDVQGSRRPICRDGAAHGDADPVGRRAQQSSIQNSRQGGGLSPVHSRENAA